jgi:pilus assembly protein FimV
MMTRTFASVAVMAAWGLLAPMQVSAFGLGKLELSSALNEPFKAEIAITALKGDDANNLQVRLASSKEFEQAGIERNFLLTQLKFDVVEKSGHVKIVISSQQPIREPFIDFLLTATTTGSGRLIREYTVLLDPPKSIFNKPGTPLVQSPTKVSAKNTATTNVTTTNYKSASFDGDSYGPVIRTDTLWEVALKTRPDNNVTVHQMMMALLKANPGAFQYDNVNGLKGYL